MFTARGFAVLALLVAVGGARAESYRDDAKHFALELPENWQKITAQFVAAVNGFAKQRLPGEDLHYETGFQMRDRGPGQYPYILLQWKAGAPPRSYEALERGLDPGNVKQEVAKAERAMSDLVKNTSLGGVVLDRAHNRFVTRFQMDGAGVGKIDGITVGFLGKEGILLLHGYDRQGDFPHTGRTFDRIFDSVRFDPGFVYEPSRFPFELNSAVQSGVVGGVVAAIVVSLMMARKRKLAANDRANDTQEA